MPAKTERGKKIEATMIKRMGREKYEKFLKRRGRLGGISSSNKEWANSPEGQEKLRRAQELSVKARVQLERGKV